MEHFNTLRKNIVSAVFSAASYMILCFSFYGTQNVFASTSIDFRTEYEHWNTGIKGKTSAPLFGFGATHYISPMVSVSGGIVSGSHTSDKNSEGSNNDPDSLKRFDLDIAAGYHRFPNLILFAGYRLVKIDYDHPLFPDRSFSDLTHGAGIGVAAYQPVFSNTIAYGRFGLSGLLSTLQSDPLGEDRGTGFSTGFEAGIIYQLVEKTNIGAAIKQQSSTIDYRNNGPKWQNNYLRIGISLSRRF